ncbi:hypothetical protein D3C86_1161880 [compost metagenome]
MALKSTSETVRSNGLTTNRKKSNLSEVNTFQKLASSKRCNSDCASKIAIEFLGKEAICFLSFETSLLTIEVFCNSCAFSILSNRIPNKRTGKGIEEGVSRPLGVILKYSKLSQQSKIKKFSLCVHHGFILVDSNNRVPRPIICQNLV